MTASIDLINEASAQKAAQANKNFYAAWPAMTFAKRSAVGLTLNLYGGMWDVDGEPTLFDDVALLLDDASTCYVYLEKAGSPLGVTFDTSAPTDWPGPMTDKTALFFVTTAGGAITVITDLRVMGSAGGGGGAGTPAGSTKEIQYNDDGDFAGDPQLLFDNIDKILTTRRVAVNANNVNIQSGTSYTLVDADNGAVITLDNAASITLTVPSGLDNGFSCMLIQLGAGVVTVAGSGATVNSFGSLVDTAGAFAAATLYAYDTNEFWLGGQLA